MRLAARASSRRRPYGTNGGRVKQIRITPANSSGVSANSAYSPRNIGYDTARALGQRVRGRAQKVALFVDPTDQELTAGIEALEPDMLQLHGAETPDRVVRVRERFGLSVMKALPIEQRADLAAVKLYEKVADRLIFDARPPREATRPGGLGQSFDWQLLQNLDTRLANNAMTGT